LAYRGDYRDLGHALESARFLAKTATWRRNNLMALETQLVGYGALLVWVNPVDRNLEAEDFEQMLLRVQASA